MINADPKQINPIGYPTEVYKTKYVGDAGTG